MGEVYKPEDMINRRGKPTSDLAPAVPPQIMSTNLEVLLQEIRFIRGEIKKIKKALRAHGINIP